MKKFKLLGLVLVLGCLLVSAGQVKAMSSQPKKPKYSVKQHPEIKNLEIIKNFNTPLYGAKRTLYIYLPPDYHQTDKKYPVLYMQDGSNLFENDATPHGSWLVDEAATKLFKEGKTEGVIIVGIGTGINRAREYNPWKFEISGRKFDFPVGKKYAKFMVNTLKPYIDQHYRTLSGRDHTGIAGSSFGGTISLYAGLKYQDVFSKIGALSASLWQGEHYYDQYPGKMFEFINKIEKNKDMKIYMDIGRKEHPGAVPRHKKLYEMLHKKGFKKQNLKLVIDDDGEHSEKYWAERFPTAFLWLYE